ncbi:MAG: hypothetical protein ACYS26_06820 [Planctomycetota bacterium]|jgi:hypothetical protein
MSSIFSSFPNSSQDDAYFDPLRNQIVLFNTNQNEWNEVEEPKSAIGFAHRVTFAHELQHWLDCTRSRWGHEMFTSIANGIWARNSLDESEFWRVVELHRAVIRSFPSDYFLEQQSSRELKISDRLLMRPTRGFRFNSKGRIDRSTPQLFVRFSTPIQEVARIPLSPATLTECSATCAEIEVADRLSATLDDERRSIYRGSFQEKIGRRLRDPDHLIYFAGAHIIANHLGVGLFDAIKAAGCLARVCLDLPRSRFVRLSTEDLSQSDQSQFRQKTDRGFAFYCLAKSAPSPTGSILDWLNQTLSASGLPSPSELRSESAEESQAARSQLLSGVSQPFVNLYELSANSEYDYDANSDPIELSSKGRVSVSVELSCGSTIHYPSIGRYPLSDASKISELASTTEPRIQSFLNECGS